jgi:hypothetical protein
VLTPTLLAVYESAEQGGLAAGYLEGHAAFAPLLIRLLTSDERRSARAVLRAVVPADFWQDAPGAVDERHALLLVFVDELDAFKAREVLDEETSSVRVDVLPPDPLQTFKTARKRLDESEAADGRRETPDRRRADRNRRRTRAVEAGLHDH